MSGELRRYQREYMRKRRATFTEEQKEAERERARRYQRKRRAANPAKAKQYQRDYQKKNKAKILGRMREYRRLKTYGLSKEGFDALFRKQRSKCAICHSPSPGTRNDWHVDHCHTSKRIRGILCGHCNALLGYAKDNINTLKNAARYLRR